MPLVVGIPAKESEIVLVAAKVVVDQAEVAGIIKAAMRIHGVVAAVLNDIGGDHADARGLRQRGDQSGINLQGALVYRHIPPRIAP